MSVNPLIIFYLLFSMIGFYFHLTNTTETSWSYHGILHKPSYKANIYGKNSIVASAINAWNNLQKLLKTSLRHLSLIKSKKRCQMSFLRSIEMSTFRYFKLMLDDFQTLQALYSIVTFSL